MKQLSAAWKRMSARERGLILAAGSLAAIIATVYLGIIPGLDAARSAENRRAHDSANLAEVRDLSAELAALRDVTRTRPESNLQAAASGLADSLGVRVLDTSTSGNALSARLEAPTSAAVIAWISGVSQQTGLGARSFSITRSGSDGVVASVAFIRGAS